MESNLKVFVITLIAAGMVVFCPGTYASDDLSSESSSDSGSVTNEQGTDPELSPTDGGLEDPSEIFPAAEMFDGALADDGTGRQSAELPESVETDAKLEPDPDKVSISTYTDSTETEDSEGESIILVSDNGSSTESPVVPANTFYSAVYNAGNASVPKANTSTVYYEAAKSDLSEETAADNDGDQEKAVLSESMSIDTPATDGVAGADAPAKENQNAHTAIVLLVFAVPAAAGVLIAIRVGKKKRA